jgi:alpha-ketoglutarate-dependent taurine dioxygenase
MLDPAAEFASEEMAATFGTIVTATRAAASLGELGPHRDALRESLRESGALLVRGFEFDLAAFEAFCSLFSDRAVVHPGTAMGTRAAVTDTTATVDSGVLPFPWHSELGYAPKQPDLVVFACERAPAERDETFLTDGCAIADRLSADARAVAARRIRYSYHRTPDAWPAAFGGATTRDEAEAALREIAASLPESDDLAWSFRRLRRRMDVRYTTPALPLTRWDDRMAFCNHIIFQESRRPGGVARLEDGSAIPAAAVAEFVRLADECSFAIRWREGDVAMVDNSRVMHARGPVTDPARRILARNCQAAF